MAGQFQVSPDALRAHAKKLDGYANRLGQAVDAARQVSMPEGAYGIICQFLPPLINPIEERGVQALEASAEGVETAASNVNTTVSRYESTDDNHASAFENVTSQMN